MASLDDGSGTLDYYSFTVPFIPTGARIIIDIDCGQNAAGTDSGCGGFPSGVGGMDSYIELYAPWGGTYLVNDDDSFDVGSESSSFDSRLELVAPVPGVWKVAVGQFPNLAPIAPGKAYILHVSVQGVATAESEPNDAFATAQNLDRLFSLRLDAQVQDQNLVNSSTAIPHADVVSRYDASGTIDYYSFTVQSNFNGNGTITVDVDCAQSSTDTGCAGYAGALDSWIVLYDPLHNPVAFDDDSGGDIGSDNSARDSFLHRTNAESGVWTVAVGQYPDLTPIKPGSEYILHVSVVGANADPEPNDSLANAQRLDGLFNRTFDPQVEDGSLVNTSTVIPHAAVNSLADGSGTLDYFSIYVPIGGVRIVADIDCAYSSAATGCSEYPGGMDSWLQLFEPGGNLVASNDDAFLGDTGSEGFSRDSFAEVFADSAGVWTVGVGVYPNLSPIPAGSGYILHVSMPEPPASAGLVAGALALAGLGRRRAIAARSGNR